VTEDEARVWLAGNFDVSRETWEQLERFVSFLAAEAKQQNLISAATIDHIWARHIVDSAQLLGFAPGAKSWLDLGSGAGFPGLVAAMLSEHIVTLSESRAKRIDYLERAIVHLGLAGRAKVAAMPVERMETVSFHVISARAFAPLPRLLDLSSRFSTAKTIWLLPKGRNAVKELHEAHGRWNLDFTVEPSVTDCDAGILVGHVLAEREHWPATSPMTAPVKGPFKRRQMQ
jgi:16S rRNA (guanine527-N7)-methyltransferase